MGKAKGGLAALAAKAHKKHLAHIRPEVQRLREGPSLSAKQYEDLHARLGGLNSWEKEHLIPILDDAALTKHAEYTLENCAPKLRAGAPCVTYDESMVHIYGPELIKRVRAYSPASRPV